jgi:hypothetical protein
VIAMLRFKQMIALGTPLVLAAAWVAVLHTPIAQAQSTIQVTTTAAGINADTDCSLQEAILAANWDDSLVPLPDNRGGYVQTGCTAGSGADIIELPPGATYTMDQIVDDAANYMGPTATPLITSDITIEGHGAVLQHGASATNVRLFAVGDAGRLDLREVDVKGFHTTGGDGADGGGGGLGAGGAIFVAGGSLLVESSTFEGNGATGGSSKSSNEFGAGGGGGGLGGAGGPANSTFRSGGGGGGARGAGDRDGRGGGTVTDGADGGYSCGGAAGDGLVFNDGQDGCDGGGGGGGEDAQGIFPSGNGGGGGFGGGGGGGGADRGDGGHGGFVGGGGGAGPAFGLGDNEYEQRRQWRIRRRRRCRAWWRVLRWPGRRRHLRR